MSIDLQVFTCEHARLDLEQIFGREAQALVAHLNIEGQHRGAVAAATAMQKHDAAHRHDEGIEHDPKKCKLCTDDHQHEHNHAHDHGHDGHGHAMSQDAEGKQHSHGREHADGLKHEQSDGHKHEHSHADGHEHKHHHHSHERQETTAASRFGIRSFVYSRRLPFHPQRYVA